MTRRDKAILALVCAAEIINCAKAGVLKSRITDLETQRDIYASRAQHWIDRAVEDEEVIDSMIEKVVYNDFDCAYKSDLEGFNLDDTVKGEVEVKKMAVGIYYMGEILIPVTTEDKHMVGLICWSQLAPVEDEIKNNGFIRYYQRKRADGRTYYVVKNGMRVRAAVTSYSLNEYAEATLQELVAMLAETHTGEPEEHEQTFDNLTDEVENEANNEDV